MGAGLRKADLATRTYSLAVQLYNIKLQRQSQKKSTDLYQMLTDICLRLEENFSLTSDQTVCYSPRLGVHFHS